MLKKIDNWLISHYKRSWSFIGLIIVILFGLLEEVGYFTVFLNAIILFLVFIYDPKEKVRCQ